MKTHLIIVSSLIVVLDQLTKFIISKELALNQSIPIIENVFHLTLTNNTGATFGILKDYNFMLVILSLIAIIFVIYLLNKSNDLKEGIMLALLLGGAIGNLIDRIVFGYVIDFIDFRIWPVFNIADSAVTIGVIGLIIYYSVKQ